MVISGTRNQEWEDGMPAYTHNQIHEIRMIISLSPVLSFFFLSKHFQPLTTGKMRSYTTASLNKRQSFCMFSSHIMVCFVLLSFGHFHPEYNIKPAQSRSLRHSKFTPPRVLSVQLHHERTNSSIREGSLDINPLYESMPEDATPASLLPQLPGSSVTACNGSCGQCP